MALASKVVLQRTTTNPWRLPFSLLHAINFSNSAASTATPIPTNEATKKPKRRKKKNLFEVAQFLPNWGIGYHMAKTHWNNVSYEITKMNLYKDGRHGKAWGVAYRDGVPAAEPKKMSGVHKRCWRYLPKPINLEAEVQPESEAQAATPAPCL